MPLTANMVVQAIEEAWADAQPPKAGSVLLPDAIKDEEELAVERDFGSVEDWRELDPRFIDQSPNGLGTALCFLSDEATCYFIAAYMVADVRGQLSHASPLYDLRRGFDGQVYGQCAWSDPEASKRWRSLTTRQAQAIVTYLQFCCERDSVDAAPAQAALSQFWLTRAALQPDHARIHE